MEADFLFVRHFRHRVRDRKVHDVFDRLREVVRVGVHALDNLLMAIVHRLGQLITQNVQVAENRLYGRAKFVREIGERLHVQPLLPLARLNSRCDHLDGCSGLVTII